MARKQLFQYAVLWHPTEKQAEEGQESKVLVPITTVLAETAGEVNMMASLQIPEDYRKALIQVEVAVVPF